MSNTDFNLNQDLEKGTSSQHSDNNDPELRSAPNNEYNPNIAQIQTSFHNNQEVVHIGDQKVYKDDLVRAFGGTLVPGLMEAPVHKFANPAPLGLSAFSLTTLVLSLCNVQARHVSTPNIVVGLAFFYGGTVQLLAGMWEMALQNTFGATALSSYGGFWLSYGAIQTDAFGIVAAYGDNKQELSAALGFFLIGWFIFTFMLVLCTVKSTVAFCALFAFLDLTFLLLACGEFTGKVGVTKAGGAVGCVTAFIGFYNAYAGIATPENSYLPIKPMYLPGANAPISKKST